MVMANERWQQIKEVFHSALEYEPAERPAFLARACPNDEAFRKEVESLIEAHEKEGSFIDAPAFELAAGWLANDTPDSLIGKQIDHYRILETLGTGGMGEVYLAQDTRLGRKIALKLLPASFTNDPDRLHRFQQEARAASALNHPNILTIHEVGSLEGRPYIATELIEGETLRQRLTRGRLDSEAALDIIMQAASALVAAHEVGIIHRDIKPENIMLRPDGYVKVLDFGLAKLAGRKAARSNSEAPTRIQDNTSPGMVMGTVNYMSPEQARGLPVDERTDIWSLGVVFYEMLSGQTPFQGATPTDVTVAILERDPAALTAFSEDVPAELDWMVKKALRKDSEERYQTIKELLGDLRGVKQELEFEAKLERTAAPDKHSEDAEAFVKSRAAWPLAGATTNRAVVVPTNEIKGAQEASSVEPLSRKARSSRTPYIAAAAALCLAVVGIAFYKFFFQGEKAVPFQVMNITRLTNNGKATTAAISPDGKYFVYVLSDAGKQSLWLRQISAANDTVIVPPAPGGYFGVTFSRDGSELYYVLKVNDAGTLYKIPVLGGTPVKVLEKIDSPVSFSPDGKRLTFMRGDYPARGESGLFIANADGSNERQIAARKFPEVFHQIFFTGPSWSPDGRLVASAVTNTKSESRVITVNAEDGREQVLTPTPWPYIGRVEWLPDMTGLLMNAREQGATVAQIWHLSYPEGETRKVTNDLNTYRAISLTADAGSFATVQTSGLMSVWVAPGGEAERAVQLPSGNIGYSGGNEGVSWTLDGRIVFVSTFGKRGDIWIMNADGSNRKQLTSGAANNHNPVVTPDGRYIIFTSSRSGQRNVWRMNLDGSDLQRLTTSMVDFLPAVSPDGRWVVYSSLTSGNPTLWKVPVGGGTPEEIINRLAINPTVSPDGRLIAYLFTEAPDLSAPPNRMAIIPFEGGEPIKTFEIPGGLAGARTILHWSQDGRSVLYTVIVNNVSNIWSQPVGGGKPAQLTNFKEHIITSFEWSRDGKQLAVSRGVLIRDVVLISNSK
ncbi:MAG TPA: protein kinase [Pyrinomonadaceae bacterium]|nr:protein kinase [Pyrinomonadaceae bacterium]